MSRTIEIVEVGPRDGLQDERTVLTTEQKLWMITGLVSAGIRRIEVASFVNPRLVPQMADAEVLVSALPQSEEVTYIGLVLNKKGALRALETDVSQLGVGVVASDTFGLKNQGQTVQQSISEATSIVRLARESGRPAQVSIAVSFGCPFESRTRPAVVVDIARRLAESGPIEIGVADTFGVAVPAQVTELVGMLREAVDIPIRAHFHDTSRTGLANVWAAVQAGATSIDASVAGLGGCPSAPDAAGNVATEDTVYLLEQSGIKTGVDRQEVKRVATWLCEVLGRGAQSNATRKPKRGAN